MKNALNLTAKTTNVMPLKASELWPIDDAIKDSWQRIAPFWPLKNLIAVNPLQGLEDLPIEDALVEGAAYFQQASLPKPLETVNRETIKWVKAFCDEGQATIPMPLRNRGLYTAWRQLARFDTRLHGNDAKKQAWLAALPEAPEAMLAEGLLKLNIPRAEQTHFFTLLLTTLPGWAAHIKYRTEWAGGESAHPHPVTQADYLAMRLAITYLLWPQAADLLDWHRKAYATAKQQRNPIEAITQTENAYRLPLLNQLAAQTMRQPHTPAAQLVFCIDVRSEPFRRALEAKGDYETLGFAGFFGIPVRIEDSVTAESYASCPVFLKPKHTIKESPAGSQEAYQKDYAGYARLTAFKRFYQSMKYTFTTPFALVETLGLASGVWMGLRSFAPTLAMQIKTAITQTIRPQVEVTPALENITLMEQCAYAEGALRMMGLTRNFAPLVILCGHGSTTQNNAYATALDCGACGGRHGASNARLLAAMLNSAKVRDQLIDKGLVLPESTRFIAAEHNTTTDEVTLYTHEMTAQLSQLKDDLEAARKANSQWRAQEMGFQGNEAASAAHTALRSVDWAQVRPEWGLARNAAFIVAPRALTREISLEGRAFLHSYDWQQDPEGAALTVILTAPMVVAQWINTQYLFSTLDNVAYGGGSKITKNITGKIGIMQGNASDLMHGLPLQSVYYTDTEAYHQAMRLLTVVYAPRALIDGILRQQEVLKKLFGNGWVTLACLEPSEKQPYFLQRDFTWQKAD